MKVGEIMSAAPSACGPDDNLRSVARIMWDQDCGSVPVVDAENRVIGMITDRDICMAAMHTGRTLEECDVASTMTRTPQTCRRDDAMEQAERVMSEHKVRRLPVVEADGTLCGVISLNDIALATSRNVRQQSAAGAARTLTETLAAISEHRPNPGSAAAAGGH